MLAEKICKVFSKQAEQKDMSEEAMKRHEAETNSKQLLSIYQRVLLSE